MSGSNIYMNGMRVRLNGLVFGLELNNFKSFLIFTKPIRVNILCDT
jgi:hypothetical protein